MAAGKALTETQRKRRGHAFLPPQRELDEMPGTHPDQAPAPGSTAEDWPDGRSAAVSGPGEPVSLPPGADDLTEPGQLTAAPLTSQDLACALANLGGWQFARFAGDGTRPSINLSSRDRGPGEPGAGAHEVTDYGAGGVTIEVTGPDWARRGTVPWSRISAWLAPALTLGPAVPAGPGRPGSQPVQRAGVGLRDAGNRRARGPGRRYR